MESTIDRIGTLLTARFGVSRAELSRDTALRDLDLDSLALVEFGLVAEKEFGVALGEQEISLDHTVADVADLIASKSAS
jgi:acyl carrier protein